MTRFFWMATALLEGAGGLAAASINIDHQQAGGAELAAASAQAPSGSGSFSWPMPEWSHAAPAAMGLDAAKLGQAREYALTGGGSGYITRHGRLVMAWGDARQRYDLKSTTKSFGSVALGVALREGKVRLQDRAQARHPALGIPPESNRDTGWLREITLHHLASQTAGFEKPGGYTPLLFWPLTWGDDDALYMAYGDGHGFHPAVPAKLSLGLARITGTPPNFTGENVRAPSLEQLGDGARGKKASGLLMVDGVLYLWARNAGNAQLAWSLDRGKHWSWADWRFEVSFGCPTFLQFGRDYAGARDEHRRADSIAGFFR